MKHIDTSLTGDDTFLAHSQVEDGVHTPISPLDSFVGTSGNDTLTGTTGNDTFDLTAGGSDTVYGLAGDDVINMGNTLDASDHIDGGAGNDVVQISGAYSSLVLGATTLTSVEDLQLAAGANYHITTNDGTVAAGATLQVDASQLSGNTLTFDGSAETDGSFVIIGGAGNDTITGGNGPDFIDASFGGNDTINLGGDSNDPNEQGDGVYFGAAFTANDSVNGGDPSNTSNAYVELQGDYSTRVVLKDSTLSNIGDLYLDSGASSGHTYNYYIASADATVANGEAMVVYGESLKAGETMRFDGSAENAGGGFLLYGGAGNDNLVGGSGDDYFRPGAGDDYVDGGGGKNRITYSDDHNGVTVSLVVQSAQNTGDGTDTLHNIQDLSGGSGNDTLTGNNDANWIWGEGGSDTINGLGGNDIIQVGTLTGALGTDTVDGGTGINTLSFDDNGTMISGVTFSLALQGSAQTTGMDTVTANNFQNVTGTSLDDTLTGDSHNNVLYGSGGDDVLSGGDGNDTLYGDKVVVPADSNGGGDGPTDVQDYDTDSGGNDTLDGGLGNDTALYSDATSGVTVNLTLTGSQNVGGGLGHDTLVSIENLTGSIYGDTLIGDDNDNVLIGGGGNDNLQGAGGDDTIDMSGTGKVTVSGGDGDDTIYANGSGSFVNADRVDGGAGNDSLYLDGDYSAGLTLGSSTLVNVENLYLTGAFSYKIVTADATVAAGQTLTVNASTLGAAETLDFSGAHETDGSFVIYAGAGNDTLVGGAGADTFFGGGGADKMTTSGGADTFVYQSVTESTSLTHDTIVGFDASLDHFTMPNAVAAVDTAVSGSLRSGAHFDSDLAAAVGATQLHAGDAVLFTATSGTLSGHTYLIVDANGTAGYQAGADFVIDVTGGTNLGSLSAANFTFHVT